MHCNSSFECCYQLQYLYGHHCACSCHHLHKLIEVCVLYTHFYFCYLIHFRYQLFILHLFVYLIIVKIRGHIYLLQTNAMYCLITITVLKMKKKAMMIKICVNMTNLETHECINYKIKCVSYTFDETNTQKSMITISAEVALVLQYTDLCIYYVMLIIDNTSDDPRICIVCACLWEILT